MAEGYHVRSAAARQGGGGGGARELCHGHAVGRRGQLMNVLPIGSRRVGLVLGGPSN